MVVDDSLINAQALRQVLVRSGFDVFVVFDAKEALALLVLLRPSLILLDLGLPGIGSLELARRIRAEHRTQDIPIVALASRTRAGDGPTALAEGCDACITRPLDLISLPGLVAAHVARVGPGMGAAGS